MSALRVPFRRRAGSRVERQGSPALDRPEVVVERVGRDLRAKVLTHEAVAAPEHNEVHLAGLEVSVRSQSSHFESHRRSLEVMEQGPCVIFIIFLSVYLIDDIKSKFQ